MKEKSCGTIIVKDNKVLIIKQKNTGNYGFPKGHVEGNETEVETALRETKEETNIDVEVLEDMRYECSYIVKENVPKEAVYYLAKVVNDENMEKQDAEISDINWIDLDRVEEILTFDNLRELWNNAYSDIKNNL